MRSLTKPLRIMKKLLIGQVYDVIDVLAVLKLVDVLRP